VIGYGKIITVSLSPGTHTITFRAEDLLGESDYVTISVIIDEAEVIEDDEPKKKDDETNFVFLGMMIAMVIVIVVMLLILFIVLRSKKKDKVLPTPADKRPLMVRGPPVPGEPESGTAAGTTETPAELPTAAAGTEQPPPQLQQTQPPALPQTQDTGVGAGAEADPSLRTSLDQPYVPTQIMTCPKCTQIMSFSPDGGSFCIRCGYKPDK
jgi:hypothetical protein